DGSPCGSVRSFPAYSRGWQTRRSADALACPRAQSRPRCSNFFRRRGGGLEVSWGGLRWSSTATWPWTRLFGRGQVKAVGRTQDHITLPRLVSRSRFSKWPHQLLVACEAPLLLFDPSATKSSRLLQTPFDEMKVCPVT